MGLEHLALSIAIDCYRLRGRFQRRLRPWSPKAWKRRSNTPKCHESFRYDYTQGTGMNNCHPFLSAFNWCSLSRSLLFLDQRQVTWPAPADWARPCCNASINCQANQSRNIAYHQLVNWFQIDIDIKWKKKKNFKFEFRSGSIAKSIANENLWFNWQLNEVKSPKKKKKRRRKKGF